MKKGLGFVVLDHNKEEFKVKYSEEKQENMFDTGYETMISLHGIYDKNNVEVSHIFTPTDFLKIKHLIKKALQKHII